MPRFLGGTLERQQEPEGKCGCAAAAVQGHRQPCMPAKYQTESAPPGTRQPHTREASEGDSGLGGHHTPCHTITQVHSNRDKTPKSGGQNARCVLELALLAHETPLCPSFLGPLAQGPHTGSLRWAMVGVFLLQK